MAIESLTLALRLILLPYVFAVLVLYGLSQLLDNESTNASTHIEMATKVWLQTHTPP